MSIIAPILFFASLTAAGQTTTISTPEQWEYKIIGCIPEAELNKLGVQGWELVSVRGHETSCYNYYLKRPKGYVTNYTLPAPPPPPAPICNLSLAQAPVISGFRLGMGTDELLEKFPRSKDQFNVKQALAQADSQYGSTKLVFSPKEYPDSKSFGNNTSQYTFDLLDGRVVGISISYNFNQAENPNWTADTWTDIISEKLKLPARESWSSDGYNTRIVCQGFSANLYAHSNSTSVIIWASGINEIINSRRNAEYEKRRREFKP